VEKENIKTKLSVSLLQTVTTHTHTHTPTHTPTHTHTHTHTHTQQAYIQRQNNLTRKLKPNHVVLFMCPKTLYYPTDAQVYNS